jgi:hypothetical protein
VQTGTLEAKMSPEDKFQKYWSNKTGEPCDFSDHSEVFTRDDLFEAFVAGYEEGCDENDGY